MFKKHLIQYCSLAVASFLAVTSSALAQVAGAPNVQASQHVELSSYVKFSEDARHGDGSCGYPANLDRREGFLDTSINFNFERVTQTMPRGKQRDWKEIIPEGAALIVTDIAWKLGSSKQMDPGGYLQVEISSNGRRNHSDYFTHHVGYEKSWRGLLTGRQSMQSGILYVHGEELCATLTYFNDGNTTPPVQAGALTGIDWHYVKLYGYLVEHN